MAHLVFNHVAMTKLILLQWSGGIDKLLQAYASWVVDPCHWSVFF